MYTVYYFVNLVFVLHCPLTYPVKLLYDNIIIRQTSILYNLATGSSVCEQNAPLDANEHGDAGDPTWHLPP